MRCIRLLGSPMAREEVISWVRGEGRGNIVGERNDASSTSRNINGMEVPIVGTDSSKWIEIPAPAVDISTSTTCVIPLTHDIASSLASHPRYYLFPRHWRP